MRKSALVMLGLVVASLVALGLLVLSSASIESALKEYHNVYGYLQRQISFVVVGAFLALIVAKIDYHFWSKNWGLTLALCVITIILLLLVFCFPKTKGSFRWIDFKVFKLQPGEFAKVAVVVAVSVWLDQMALRLDRFRIGVLSTVAIFGVFALLLYFEPDYGSLFIVLVLGFMLMFVAGIKMKVLLPVVFFGVCAFAIELFRNSNRRMRLLAFFSDSAPEVVKSSSSRVNHALYQTNQSLVAIQNGGIGGVGLNESMQKHFYLPEAHTDFIFAIGAEELGLMFSVVTLFLFCCFFALGIYISFKATDRLGRFLALGMTVLIFFSAMFNVGVVCRALPTKGIALPFFSYGGTNMIATMIAVGVIFSVGMYSLRNSTRRVTVSRAVRVREE